MHACIIHGRMCTVHWSEVSLEDVCWLDLMSGCSFMGDFLGWEESLHAVLLDHGASVYWKTDCNTDVALIFLYTHICEVALAENACLFAKLKTLAEGVVCWVLTGRGIIQLGKSTYPTYSSLLLVHYKIWGTQEHRWFISMFWWKLRGVWSAYIRLSTSIGYWTGREPVHGAHIECSNAHFSWNIFVKLIIF